MVLHRFVRSPAGVIGEAILTNEIRVEYLGTSVARVLRLTYVLGAAAGGLGGALVGAGGRPYRSRPRLLDHLRRIRVRRDPVGHRPCGGAAHRHGAVRGGAQLRIPVSPYTWQMVVGISMLAVILFLPSGLVVAVHAPSALEGPR